MMSKEICTSGERPNASDLKSIYIFGWPSNLGGASTKLCHLLKLLHRDYDITLVPDHAEYLNQTDWCGFVRALGVKICLFEALPLSLKGWGLAMCNPLFLKAGHPEELMRRGLTVVWSNDMMWHMDGELEAILFGTIQKVVFVSQCQKDALIGGYTKAMGGLVVPREDDNESGCIQPLPDCQLPWVIAGNYILPEWFPFRDRFSEQAEGEGLSVGRLSRPDPHKYPSNFPTTYEALGLKRPRFRVMGWDEAIAAQWPEHVFGEEWELLKPMEESQVDFYHSIDLFVYQPGEMIVESWGRTVVEAMLTGAIPIVERGKGHLDELILHGETGYLCESQEEFGHYARLLENDRELRRQVSLAGRRHAVECLCDEKEHLRLWGLVFS